jgi:hypothetical protein
MMHGPKNIKTSNRAHFAAFSNFTARQADANVLEGLPYQRTMIHMGRNN